jgi:hypothetical protein
MVASFPLHFAPLNVKEGVAFRALHVDLPLFLDVHPFPARANPSEEGLGIELLFRGQHV